MSQLKRQEAFSEAVAGIIAQGQYSATDDYECKYLGPANTKCAVGQLLKDDPEAISEIEGLGASAIADSIHLLIKPEFLEGEGELNLEDSYFLSNMQYAIHDSPCRFSGNLYDQKEFLEHVHNFAKREGLETPCLTGTK